MIGVTKQFIEASKLLISAVDGYKRTLGGLLLFVAGAPFLSDGVAQVLYWVGGGLYGVGVAHAENKKRNGKSGVSGQG